MNPFRRFTIVLFALAISAMMLRPQLSSALLTRGDTLAYWGRRADARRAYAKALLVDPRNGVAADRLVTDAAFSHDAATVHYGVAVANRYLDRNPADPAVLADRALCYQHLAEYRRAIGDFESAGRLAHDPRALLFAALDEERIRDVAAARRLLHAALAFDPRFAPAARDLRVRYR